MSEFAEGTEDLADVTREEIEARCRALVAAWLIARIDRALEADG